MERKKDIELEWMSYHTSRSIIRNCNEGGKKSYARTSANEDSEKQKRNNVRVKKDQLTHSKHQHTKPVEVG